MVFALKRRNLTSLCSWEYSMQRCGSFVTAIVTLKSLKHEKMSWFTKMATGKWSVDCCFLPTPLAPNALSPASLALSIQMLSPFPLYPLVALPLHSCCFHSGFHVLLFSWAAVLTSNWTLPPISPHHPKMWSYLIGRKPRSEPWIHGSLFFGVKSELISTLARSFRDGPSFPSSLVSVTFKCDAFTCWTGRGNLSFYTSTHFIFLCLLFFAHLLLLEILFTTTHSVMFLTTSTDLWIKLDWNHLVRCLFLSRLLLLKGKGHPSLSDSKYSTWHLVENLLNLGFKVNSLIKATPTWRVFKYRNFFESLLWNLQASCT